MANETACSLGKKTFEGVFNKTETYKLYLAGHELKALISKED